MDYINCGSLTDVEERPQFFDVQILHKKQNARMAAVCKQFSVKAHKTSKMNRKWEKFIFKKEKMHKKKSKFMIINEQFA